MVLHMERQVVATIRGCVLICKLTLCVLGAPDAEGAFCAKYYFSDVGLSLIELQ